jgi:hypothetical protein
MGKLKAVLDDLDISEHSLDGSPDEPSPTDFHMQQLASAISELEKHAPFGYDEELEISIMRLTKVLGKVERPF